jgi:acetyltransferase-like isoleucine patch superfamily enzyme
MKTALRNWRELSIFKTLRFNGQLGSRWIFIYPKVHIGLGNHCKVSNHGRLHIGRRWRQSAFLPSQLVLLDKASLAVTGEFSLHTGFSVFINEGARLELGSGYINNGFRLSCFERISIGDHVAIAENVTMRDSDDHTFKGRRHEMTQPITIGNRVWIGMNATILKGVTIGDGAVVAANALVNRDVPPSTLVAGVPAKVVKTGIEWC